MRNDEKEKRRHRDNGEDIVIADFRCHFSGHGLSPEDAATVDTESWLVV
jgi:hypothetical protein